MTEKLRDCSEYQVIHVKCFWHKIVQLGNQDNLVEV